VHSKYSLNPHNPNECTCAQQPQSSGSPYTPNARRRHHPDITPSTQSSTTTATTPTQVLLCHEHHPCSVSKSSCGMCAFALHALHNGDNHGTQPNNATTQLHARSSALKAVTHSIKPLGHLFSHLVDSLAGRHAITEPLVGPIRRFCKVFDVGRNLDGNNVAAPLRAFVGAWRGRWWDGEGKRCLVR
jgi:hypothetical protein